MFIKLLYYLRIVLITVANFHTLELCEQVLLHVKRCIIIFFLNNLSQFFENHPAKFFFATECTGDHRLQRANKADGDDSFNVFIVIVFK